jgi:tripartite-type tricarboxylate transporter receptor subunit TctC
MLGGLAAMAGVRPAAGQEDAGVYPDQPVHIVSPVAPGTGLDEWSRRLARWLEERLRQPVIVDIRQGANTILAAAHVASARPDGHTLLYAPSSTMVINPFLYKSLPYRPLEDFAPIAKLIDLAVAVVVAPDAPYASLGDLVAAARRQPHKLNFGYTSGGYRAMGAAVSRAAGIDVVTVPYRTLSNLLPDLVAGRIDYILLETSTASTMVQAGQLRALAVLSQSRLPTMAKVPTLQEQGFPVPALQSWMGLFAPARTPRPIVERLSGLAQAFVRSPQAAEFALARGALPAAQGPEELRRTMLADQERWRTLVERAGIERE